MIVARRSCLKCQEVFNSQSKQKVTSVMCFLMDFLFYYFILADSSFAIHKQAIYF